MLDWTWLWLGLTGQDPPAQGNRDVAIEPAAIFPSRDRLVAIAAPLDQEFRGLCQAMRQPDLSEDPRFATQDARLVEEHLDELLGIVGEWVALQTSEEVVAAGRTYGFAAAPVVSGRDHYEDEHLRAKGRRLELRRPDLRSRGGVRASSEALGHARSAALDRRPVGFDNHHVFGSLLGLSPARLTELEAQGTLRTWGARPGAQPPADWQGEGTL